MTEQPFPPEISPETQAKAAFIGKILRGDYGDEPPPEEGVEPPEAFSGTILDLNDTSLPESERAFLHSLIVEMLGSDPEEAPVRIAYASPNGQTTVVVYDVPIPSGENQWYISRWQTEGEQPQYVFWPDEQYEYLLETGYEVVEQ